MPTAIWKAVPTAICNSRLRSGSAHWDLELAVEVRLCPLGFWTARRRRRVRRRRWRRRRWRRRRRTALIKSNNPHLAGGEKHLKAGYFQGLCFFGRGCNPFKWKLTSTKSSRRICRKDLRSRFCAVGARGW